MCIHLILVCTVKSERTMILLVVILLEHNRFTLVLAENEYYYFVRKRLDKLNQLNNTLSGSQKV